MFSFTIITFGYVFLIYGRSSPGPKPNDKSESLLSIFYAIILGYSTTGAIGLFLTINGHLNIPVLIPSLIFFLSCFLDSSTRRAANKLARLTFKSLLLQAKKSATKARSGTYYLLIITTILIAIGSIGPINHPDAADYHVGYAFQYLMHNKLIVDGGLHQGLLGLGDYVNIAFIQEKTTWLIRTAQITPLVPLVILFLYFETSQIAIYTFLISLVFIGGWATIGKPLFLGDICIACIYILHACRPSKNSCYSLISAIALGVSLKISTLLIGLPILLHILANISAQSRRGNCYQKPRAKRTLDLHDSLVLISIGMLALVMYSRYLVTGNPFFPFMSHLLSPRNPEYAAFEQFLRSYLRDSMFFPIQMIFPASLGQLGLVLGPAAMLIAIHRIIKFKYEHQKFKRIIITGILQIILLLIFAQGRIDYYASPLVLLICHSSFGASKNSFDSTSFIGESFYKLAFMLILVQGIVFYGLLGTSMYQTLMTSITYNKSMKSWAYGFDAADQLNKSLPPYVNLLTRNTRYYFSRDYVDADKFKRCMSQVLPKESNDQAAIEACMSGLNVRSILAPEMTLQTDGKLECEITTVSSSGRNPFNRAKIRAKLCALKP